MPSCCPKHESLIYLPVQSANFTIVSDHTNMENHLREYIYDTSDNICKIASSIFNHHSDTPISVRSSVYCIEVESMLIYRPVVVSYLLGRGYSLIEDFTHSSQLNRFRSSILGEQHWEGSMDWCFYRNMDTGKWCLGMNIFPGNRTQGSPIVTLKWHRDAEQQLNLSLTFDFLSEFRVDFI